MALHILDDVDVAMDAPQLARILTRAIDPGRLRPLTLGERVALEVLRDAVATARPAAPGTRIAATLSAPEVGELHVTGASLLRLTKLLMSEAAEACGTPGRPGPVLSLTLSLVMGDATAEEVPSTGDDAGEECDEP